VPELPDIVVLARSMDEALQGRSIAAAEVNQPKCLNVPVEEFCQNVAGRSFQQVRQRGKWALAELDEGWTLALNLGMGGEVCLHRPEEVADPKRERVVFRLADSWGLWVHFWWFGHAHLLTPEQLADHPQISCLGPEPLADDFTPERLGKILHKRRGAIKNYLLKQSFLAGIGNVYVQDILWHAGLHPLRPANTLDAAHIERLHGAIQHVLQEGIRWGGGPGEQDIWGKKGQYAEHLQVGYRTDKPCPTCGTLVQQLRTGSTTSYICPQCQGAEW
jgi:formamidopyrimidine-DNA glycosylase